MSDLESGRSALAERAWDEAFALLWSAAKEEVVYGDNATLFQQLGLTGA